MTLLVTLFHELLSNIHQVSRDGVHKLVCIWEYDKRSVNNANFVYYGMRIMRPELPKCQQMVAYADKVFNRYHRLLYCHTIVFQLYLNLFLLFCSLA